MKNRAFTLVELLAVILLISIIATLSFSDIAKSSSKYKEISYSKFVDLIESATYTYVISNDSLVNSLKAGETESITLDFLVEKEYLSKENMKNPRTNNEIDTENSVVNVSYSLNKYNYEINIVDKSVN